MVLVSAGSRNRDALEIRSIDPARRTKSQVFDGGSCGRVAVRLSLGHVSKATLLGDPRADFGWSAEERQEKKKPAMSRLLDKLCVSLHPLDTLRPSSRHHSFDCSTPGKNDFCLGPQDRRWVESQKQRRTSCYTQSCQPEGGSALHIERLRPQAYSSSRFLLTMHRDAGIPALSPVPESSYV